MHLYLNPEESNIGTVGAVLSGQKVDSDLFVVADPSVPRGRARIEDGEYRSDVVIPCGGIREWMYVAGTFDFSRM